MDEHSAFVSSHVFVEFHVDVLCQAETAQPQSFNIIIILFPSPCTMWFIVELMLAVLSNDPTVI